jgi:hypothetical protein
MVFILIILWILATIRIDLKRGGRGQDSKIGCGFDIRIVLEVGGG